MIASEKLTRYFDGIEEGVQKSFQIATSAREKGHDPEERVDIPLAKGVAERVEGLISAVNLKILKSGVAQRIIELEKEYGSLDWRVALKISEEVAKEKFFKFENKLKALETGIRVGLAYITLGVISAPLEGFIELKIKKRQDGKEYLSAFYAGPIRAAGGTAEAVSIVIADYVRLKMGYMKYDPTEKEIKRTIAEIRDYHERVTNLQYVPSDKELEFLLQNLPIEVNGDPTEELEVSNYKDLERIETNRIRGGICLVLAEGMAQKAPKVNKQLKKWGKDFGLEWEFLTKFLEIQKEAKAKGIKTESSQKISPNFTFIKDLVAGRPVLSYPLKYGGFRLRYGRTRTTGLAAAAIHPKTMEVLNRYIATGTQLKVERPGKAASITVCDSIEGPIIKTKDGSVLKLEEQLVKTEEIDKILFLGDMLLSYGDFSENGHKLVPAGYCSEWWALEFGRAIKSKFGELDENKVSELLGIDTKSVKEILKKDNKKIQAETAIKISNIFGIPLHPEYTYFWTNISTDELRKLSIFLKKARVEDNKIILEKAAEKEILEKIGLPHLFINNEFIVIDKEHSHILSLFSNAPEFISTSVLEALEEIMKLKVKDKAGTFIGARMGRPEKAKMRKLIGSPHFLFPVGEEGGRMRSIQSAIEKGKIRADFAIFYCINCRKESIFSLCIDCNQKTKKIYYNQKTKKYSAKHEEESKEYVNKEIDINQIFKKTMDKHNISILPDLLKGVKGTSNKSHVTEPILKGILRAKHNIFVNKDGTTRYDMIELPITHFKPSEIGTSIEELISLGYTTDIHGNPLKDREQVLELMPQDQILPASSESGDEPADEVLFRVANFIDELLERLYGLPRFYNIKTKQEIVGHLVVGLAPHTSAGTVGRIIGFSKTQGMYSHPLFHAAMRRNCDGDEACVMLLMDAFLNFSRSFLPDKRGSRTMDAPLVLTSFLIPGEVDDEVHGLDISWGYPLELYEAALEYKNPWDVSILQIDNVLNTPKQYEGMGYTHETSSINKGVLCSSYKLLPTMEEKLKGQMDLAEKICAVDATGVAQLVIEKHLIRDIKGNLRKFSTQQFRCVGCNQKYRRPPLAGKCVSCQGKIIFTISEGSIIKYLNPTISLAKKYNVPKYLMQTIDLLELEVISILGKDKEIQEGLGKWFS